jgi:hypothetical protein
MDRYTIQMPANKKAQMGIKAVKNMRFFKFMESPPRRKTLTSGFEPMKKDFIQVTLVITRNHYYQLEKSTFDVLGEIAQGRSIAEFVDFYRSCDIRIW